MYEPKSAAELREHYKAVRARLNPRPPRPKPKVKTAPPPPPPPAPPLGPPPVFVANFPKLNTELIIRVAGEVFNLPSDMLRLPNRAMRIVIPRQAAMYLALTLVPGMNLSLVGRAFHHDHTTVLHARDKALALIEAGDESADLLCAIRRLRTAVLKRAGIANDNP